MINYSFTLKLNLENAWKLLHRLGLCSSINVSNEAFNKEKQNNKFLHLGAQTDGRWKYFGVREIQNPSSRARRGFPKIFFENIWKKHAGNTPCPRDTKPAFLSEKRFSPNSVHQKKRPGFAIFLTNIYVAIGQNQYFCCTMLRLLKSIIEINFTIIW